MRILRSISPSALARFEKDREDFYFSYSCEHRPPRQEQSAPASVGSGYDAIVKGNLACDLLGMSKDYQDELFESQVEPHNRDFALKAGNHIFTDYKDCGAYGDLLEMMEDAQSEPQFEFDAETKVNNIPIYGKPDCKFVHKDGAHVILDWKVNGYCSEKSATSPNKGYALCRDGNDWPRKTRSHGKAHALYEPIEFMGIEINKFFMEHVSVDWADQLSMYGWMMGEEVGAENTIVCIEQIVAKPNGDTPLLRIANHRCRVSAVHQHGLAQRISVMWNALQSGHVFTELSYEDSNEKCKDLDQRALSMLSDGTAEGDFFAKCARPTKYYSAR